MQPREKRFGGPCRFENTLNTRGKELIYINGSFGFFLVINAMLSEIMLRGDAHMTSAKFSGFLPPHPLVRIWFRYLQRCNRTRLRTIGGAWSRPKKGPK